MSDIDWRALAEDLRLTLEQRNAEIELLVSAIKTVVDRHAESKEGSGLLYLPVMPHEMKKLRSALEPFRAKSTDIVERLRLQLELTNEAHTAVLVTEEKQRWWDCFRHMGQAVMRWPRWRD